MPPRVHARPIWYLVGLWVFFALVGISFKALPALKNGRKTVLDHPRPGPRAEAERVADRLIAAGFDAEVWEEPAQRMRLGVTWASTPGTRAAEAYVVRVPRDQAVAANRF